MSPPRSDPGRPAGVPEGRYVRLPGRGTTWIRETGRHLGGRPTLVLLHGWTATGALNWAPSFGTLGASFHVIALDQRGHGRGIRTHPVRGFRLEDCADDVAALADTLGIDRIVPVGYSMGGPVAQLTWRRHPDLVAGLVLCATSRNFGPRPGSGRAPAVAELAMAGGVAGAATALRTLPPGVRRRLVQAGLSRRRALTGPLPEWAIAELARNDPAALLEGFPALRRFDSTPWIAQVDVPTAVVVTSRDRVVPPERQLRLAAAIEQSRTWRVNGDHTACVTSPRDFVPALVDACRWVVSTSAGPATTSGDAGRSASGR